MDLMNIRRFSDLKLFMLKKFCFRGEALNFKESELRGFAYQILMALNYLQRERHIELFYLKPSQILYVNEVRD